MTAPTLKISNRKYINTSCTLASLFVDRVEPAKYFKQERLQRPDANKQLFVCLVPLLGLNEND